MNLIYHQNSSTPDLKLNMLPIGQYESDGMIYSSICLLHLLICPEFPPIYMRLKIHVITIFITIIRIIFFLLQRVNF